MLKPAANTFAVAVNCFHKHTNHIKICNIKKIFLQN